MRRLAPIALILLALAAATPAARGAAAGDQSQAAARAGAIVSLGDSFISGEGGRWLGNGSDGSGSRSGTDRAAYGCSEGECEYDPHRVYGASEDDDCHRSDVAPVRSAPVPLAAHVDLACSGARAADLWPSAMGGRWHFGEPPQADQLRAVARRYRVRIVLVTVGANDVGFGSLVAGCVVDFVRSDEAEPALCHDRAQTEVEAALPRMRAGVERALAGVREVLDEDGYGPGEYRLVVAGYASPFPPGRWFRYPESGWSRLDEGGCPVWDADADWAAGAAIGTIDGALREAAAARGAEFLDLRAALDGHQLCDRRSHRVGPAGPSAASAEWVRRLSFLQGSSRESLHPNAYGQRAIGICFALLWRRPRGAYACRAAPGRGLEGAMSLVPLP